MWTLGPPQLTNGRALGCCHGDVETVIQEVSRFLFLLRQLGEQLWDGFSLAVASDLKGSIR